MIKIALKIHSRLGASHTLEITHVEFFSYEDEPEVDLVNITNSYTVPTTPNTRIHKDHPITNVIGDVKSTIQTRRMIKSTFEQGLNPQALLKLYLIHLGWKQCRKNFCNSNSNRHVKIGQDTKIPQSSGPPIKVSDEVIYKELDAQTRFETTFKRSNNPPLSRGYTLGRDEGSMQQNELMDLVTKLSERVTVLETDIQQTKKVYSSAITKLILRVKKLEKTVKTTKVRRRARVVLSEDEDAIEDSSKQGRKISDIDTDPTISLVQPQQDMEYDFDATASIPVTTAGLEISTANIAVSTADAAITTASASISTVSPPRVSTAEDISGAKTLVYIRRSASKA
ncbi:hypothetical protein Tco_0723183 [Tanacetum coccineum]